MKFWLAVACVALVLGAATSDRSSSSRSSSRREEKEDEPAAEGSSFGESYSERLPNPEARRYSSSSSDDYHLEERAQERDYKPSPPKKCYPHTVTKYRTVFKDRKANVFNKVEVRNPRPQVHKTKETRHTTIRYPVFITQVIKPLLTQVETKVKPLFFTKTLKRIKTIVFTVTGIGQVTVTSVKYEKEYVTRCQKKGYGGGGGGHKGGHGGSGGYHRRDDHVESDYLDPDYVSEPAYATDRIESYEEVYSSRRRPSARYRRDVVLSPSIAEADISEASSAITNPLPFSAT